MRRETAADYRTNRYPPCGSEPAREGVLSASTLLADTPLSRAGSLPYGDLLWIRGQGEEKEE